MLGQRGWTNISCRNEFLQEKLAFWNGITAYTAEGLTKALWREEEIRGMGFWLCRHRESEFWKSGCSMSWQKKIYSSHQENEPKIPRQRVWGCNYGFPCELEICLISRKSLPKVEFVVPTSALCIKQLSNDLLAKQGTKADLPLQKNIFSLISTNDSYDHH